MKRMILMATVLTALAVHATTTEWIGGSGSSDWTVAANWDAGCPGEADTARFSAEVYVQNVPTSFHGTVEIAGDKTVSMRLDGDYEFSVKISNAKGKLHRYGSGMLTLHPAGLSAVGGKIVLAGGTMTTLKPSADGLGVFPDIEVGGWSKVYVADSPASARPTAYEPGTSALFLCEKSSLVSHYEARCLSGGSVSVSVDGTTFCTAAEGASATFEKVFAVGWHVLTTSFAAEGGDVALARSPMSERDDGTFSADILWKGVAVHDFSLGEGAQLFLGDDQALAIGTATSPSFLAGVVRGGVGSRLALLGGSLKGVDLKGLKSYFRGTLEIGRILDVSIDSTTLSDCRIVGKGTVRVGAECESLFGEGFSGRIDIPEGVTFTAPAALRGFAATGKGSLVLTDANQLGAEASFLGQVTLPPNVTVGSDRLMPQSKGVILGDGGMLSIGGRTIAYADGASDALDGFAVSGAWSLLGIGESVLTLKDGSTVSFPVNKAYLDASDALVLTDGAGQHHAAMLKSRGFSRADDWSCEFNWSATVPEDSPYVKAGNGQSLAEGTAFILQTSTENFHTYAASAAPLGSYGFFISTYNPTGLYAGIRWIDDGFVDTNPNVPEGTAGITVTKPIHFSIACHDGVLFVVMSQDGKTCSFIRNVLKVFDSNKPVYLGFSASTSWWGESSIVPWSLQKVTEFIGQVAKPDAMTVEDSTLGNLSDSQWTASGNTYRSGGAVRLVAGKGVTGFLLNKTPFPAHRPFTLQFTATCSEYSGDGAEGFSCAFQQTGTSVTHPGGSAFFLGKDVPSCGFIYYVYRRAIGWVQDGAKVDEANKVVDMSAGLANTCTLVYDGNGGMTLTVASANKTYTAHRYYPEMSSWGDDMYLTFVGATASWTWCKIVLSDMSVTRPQTAGKTVPVPVPVGADEGAHASIQTEVSGVNVNLAGAVLSAGSELTLGAAQGAATYTVADVCLTGEATLKTVGSAEATLGPAVIYETPVVCALHCVGDLSFVESLKLVGRSTWRGRSASGVLLDYTGLSDGIVRPNAYSVFDENNEDLLALRRFSLSTSDAGVSVVPNGMAVIVR